MSKISKEELKELQEQEQKKSAILHDLGVLETQKHSLLHVWADIVSQQEGAKKELEEKYGKINIDLKTGEYKEIKEDEPKK
jgi:HD superfamily phosphohydrolase